jgi:hypothetical protein
MVKGIYQGFDSAWEVSLTTEDPAESDELIRRCIVEVSSGMAEDPRSLEVNGRRQDRGLTNGFLRYWKDDSDVQLMMEQANNHILINYQSCNEVVSSFSTECLFCAS